MIEIEPILTIIGTVGFPICAYLLQYWERKEILNKLSEILQNNTIAMNELTVRTEKMADLLDKMRGEKNNG